MIGKKINRIILLFFLLVFFTGAKGQSYYFRHYQVENGLSNNTVFCCAQDNKGFMWMGTKDGLDRFDGYSFKIFSNVPANSKSLGDNFIRSLYIDRNNVLYIGTRVGIYSFNQFDETFHEVISTNDEVRAIEKDRDGNLWFVSGLTLIMWNETKRQKLEYPPNKFFYATSVCIDSSNNIWVSTTDGYLQKYHPSENSFTHYNLFTETLPATVKWIEKISIAGNHTLLAATSNYGVIQFDLEKFTVKNLLPHFVDKTEVFARDFVLTNKTELWIATEIGILVYNLSDGKFINLKKNYGNSYAISDNAVYCLYKDKEGGIWAGTYFGGINYFHGQYDLFQKYFPDNFPTSISGNVVREICEDKFGSLWIGTEDAGLNKLDKKTGKFKQFRPSGLDTDISYSNIHGLMANNNELWIGTFEHGLDIMDVRTGKVIDHFSGTHKAKKLKSNFIVTIIKTKSKDIYIGTRLGMYIYNRVLHSFDPLINFPSNCFVQTIFEDHKNIIWIGTVGNGLFAYDPSNGKLEKFIHKDSKINSLSNNTVTTIFEDSKNILWIGTEGSGLCRFNQKDKSFDNISSKIGLPGNTIYKILEDNSNKLWITTSKGLINLDPSNYYFSLFTTENGLLTDQFNYNSGYKDGAGKMYFGCVKGLISFYPDEFIKDTLKPEVYITSFSIYNREVEANQPKSPLHQSIINTGKIELLYNQSSFSIKFSALSFIAPKRNMYKYRMEGIDNDWVTLNENRIVYFTNLAPGTYTFKVKAANSSGIWNDKITSLKIVVSPPVWASKWAYATYFLLSVLFMVYLFRSYHYRIAEKNTRKLELLEHQKEHEIYQAKLEFFTNVAHEIKTPLTLIKAPLDRILEKSADDKNIGGNLKIMERNTQRLIGLTNQLLDFRKVEENAFQLELTKININELLEERYSSFKPFAEQKNISLTLSSPIESIYINADFDSIEKILNNLLYNALSYCDQKVSVKLFLDKEGSNNCIIVFKNDGNLIPEDKRDKVFNPFYRLSDSRYHQGTGIGLALSRSLVLLHKGHLFFKDESDGLNTFILSIPVSIAIENSDIEIINPLTT